MAIVEKEIQTISGWSLHSIVDQAEKWGANPRDIAIEPVSLGPGLMTVPAMIWYGQEDS